MMNQNFRNMCPSPRNNNKHKHNAHIHVNTKKNLDLWFFYLVLLKKHILLKITYTIFGVLTFQLLREEEVRCASCSVDLGLLANTS